ncbi:hypothetical protein ACFZDK_48580 [Streptomyces sp. NPDC007901]|uniref:hypothetical protein n=1 Tax=Streptomyces sp. NPDC007901 TaxID=3364785 RepID=UPI0036E798D6
MKLASHIRDDGATVAVVTDSGLVPLTDLSADVPTPLAEVEFLPVVPGPHAIWRAALTYPIRVSLATLGRASTGPFGPTFTETTCAGVPPLT